MRLKRIIFVGLVGLLWRTAMAADDDVEYYSRFYLKRGHPIGVSHKTSRADAEKMTSYLIVKRDESNRILWVKKILEGELFFHFIYKYKENGKFDSVSFGEISEKWKGDDDEEEEQEE